MQQLSNIRNLPPMPPQATMMPGPQPVPQPMQKENAIKSWLRQMGVTGNGLQQPQQPPPPPSQSQPPMDSVWHQPSSHLPNSFNAQSWMSQVSRNIFNSFYLSKLLSYLLPVLAYLYFTEKLYLLPSKHEFCDLGWCNTTDYTTRTNARLNVGYTS